MGELTIIDVVAGLIESTSSRIIVLVRLCLGSLLNAATHFNILRWHILIMRLLLDLPKITGLLQTATENLCLGSLLNAATHSNILRGPILIMTLLLDLPKITGLLQTATENLILWGRNYRLLLLNICIKLVRYLISSGSHGNFRLVILGEVWLRHFCS